MITVDVDAGPDWAAEENWPALAERAVIAALRCSAHGDLLDNPSRVEVSVKLTSDHEVQQLNAAYRGQDKATNVLSFPMIQADLLDAVDLDSDDETLLGDIVVAHGVCIAEAAAKDIALHDHLVHLLVHGTMHLLGHDHLDDAEGDRMEEVERAALASLGIADPYLVRET